MRDKYWLLVAARSEFGSEGFHSAKTDILEPGVSKLYMDTELN